MISEALIGVPADAGKSHLTGDGPWWIKTGVRSFQAGRWGRSPENGSWKDYLRAVFNNRAHLSQEVFAAPCGLSDICTTSLLVDTKESARKRAAGNVNASPPSSSSKKFKAGFRCSVFGECNYTTWQCHRRMWGPERPSAAERFGIRSVRHTAPWAEYFQGVDFMFLWNLP